MSRKKIPGKTTHRDEWAIWMGIRHRCSPTRKPKSSAIKYREKGIKVCPQWDDVDSGFRVFLADVGPRPSKNHSIDRIDNDGNYEPGNVRWATPDVQGANTDRIRYLTYMGQSLSVTEWSRRLGFSSPSVIFHRIDTLGWSVEEALSTPTSCARKKRLESKE